MPIRYRILAVLFVVLFLASGCASRNFPDPDTVTEPASEEIEEQGPRLIAVMPVDNRSDDELAPDILRHELLQQVYFKGYPVIPLSFIDDKIAAMTESGKPEDGLALSPQALGKALGVDALLYPVITTWKTSQTLLVASTDLALSFVLRDAVTGETIWSEEKREKERHFGITGGRTEEKAYISCDIMLREIIDEVMSTFPDGPESVRPAKPEKDPWYRRWFWRF